VIGTALGLHVEDVGFNQEEAGAALNFSASTRFVEGDPCALIGAQPDRMAVVMVAGSVAERVVLGDILPSGYSGDLAALKLCYPDFPDDPADLLNNAMREALDLAYEHRVEIAAVGDQLFIKGRLVGEEVEKLIAETHKQTEEHQD
jgi:hypothetical protein